MLKMKKLFCLTLAALAAFASLRAEEVKVRLSFDEGARPAVASVMQENLGAVLTEINNANQQNRDLDIRGLKLTEFAKNSLLMLWANIHFYCDDTFLTERCWNLANGTYLVRQVPLIINPTGPDKFGGGTYQEAIVEFDASGVISDIRFGLGSTVGESMESGGDEVDVERRQIILKWVERVRTAYNTKDLAFLRMIYSDDALIITGNTVRTKEGTRTSYTVQDKATYMRSLERVFARNAWINIKFSEIGATDDTSIDIRPVTRASYNPNIYGVRLRQEWHSSTYSDIGYLFLLWDFTNENEPVIHVRTWQPERTPTDEVFDVEAFSGANFEPNF